MKKAFKWLSIVLISLLVLFTAGVFFLKQHFDADFIKKQLSTEMAERYGRDLQIAGDLKLDFFPRLAISAEKVTLSEKEKQGEFLKIGALQGGVGVIPLLSGDIAVSRIALNDAEIWLKRDAKGRNNFDDFLAGKSEEKPKTATEPQKNENADKKSFRLAIDSFEIKNTTIHWQDDKEKMNVDVSDLNLSTDQVGDNAKGKIVFSSKLKSKIKGVGSDVNIKISSKYDLILPQGKLQMTDMAIDVDGKPIEKNQAKLALKAGNISLVNWKIDDLSKLSLSLDLSNDDAKQKVNAALAIGKLELTDFAIKNASDISLIADVKIPGLALKSALASAKFSNAALQSEKFSVDFEKNDANNQKISGKIQTPIAFSLEKMQVKMPNLQGDIQVSFPELIKKPVSIKTSGNIEANIMKTSVQGQLNLGFDQTKINNNFTVKSFSPLTISFKSDLDKLNVDDYLLSSDTKTAKAKESANTNANANENTNSPKQAKTSTESSAMVIDGILNVGQLQAKGLKVQQLRLPVSIKNNVYRVTAMTADLYKGKLQTNALWNASSGQLSTQSRLMGVEIEPLMKDAAEKDFISGTGDVTIDMSANNNAANFFQSLNGKGNIRLQNGAVKGFDIMGQVRKIRSSLKGETSTAVNKNEKTDFAELTGSFTVTNGIVDNRDFSAKSPFLRLAGEGNADLVKSTLDYLAKVSVVGTTKGQDGQELTELKNVTLPIKLYGPFDNINYKIDFSSALKDAAKDKAKSEIENQLTKKLGLPAATEDTNTTDKLKSGIKGLFKK